MRSPENICVLAGAGAFPYLAVVRTVVWKKVKTERGRESVEAAETAAEAKGPDLRSVFSVGLLTLLSRVLGLLREAVRAYFLGTGKFADAFQFAFQIPNMFRSLVAEGAVSSAVVPVLTRYVRGSDKDELKKVRESYLCAWFLLVAVVTLAGVLFPDISFPS